LLGSHVPYGFFDGGSIVGSGTFVRRGIELNFLAILELEFETFQSIEFLSFQKSQLGDLEVDRGRVDVDGAVTQRQAASVSLEGPAPTGGLHPTGKSPTFLLLVLIGLGRLLGGDRLCDARGTGGENQEQKKAAYAVDGHGDSLVVGC
jgi:hypothetical protein